MSWLEEHNRKTKRASLMFILSLTSVLLTFPFMLFGDYSLVFLSQLSSLFGATGISLALFPFIADCLMEQGE